MITKLVINMDVEWQLNDPILQAQRMGHIAALVKAVLNSTDGLGVRVKEIEIDKA